MAYRSSAGIRSQGDITAATVHRLSQYREKLFRNPSHCCPSENVRIRLFTFFRLRAASSGSRVPLSGLRETLMLKLRSGSCTISSILTRLPISIVIKPLWSVSVTCPATAMG